MKKFLASLVFLFASWAHAGTFDSLPVESCAPQVPYGQPVLQHKLDSTTLCRKAYILTHDNEAKIPAWVSYTLTPEHTDGCVERTNAFAADQSLEKGSRSEKSDYARSGYDIGHIANDADMSWSVDTERQSFYLSNMAPQLPELNRGIWKVLEGNVRAWAYNRKHTLLIYAGPVYDTAKDKKIGANGVVVADAFYKIVVDTETQETMAFLFPHRGAEDSNLTPFITSVAKVEEATGITFPVPSDKTAIATLWANDLKPVAKEKKLVCQR